MRLNKKTTVYFLLVLFLALVGELVIPHTHIEVDNVVLPDFSNESDHNDTDDGEGETLHSSFYHWSDVELSFEDLPQIIMAWRIDNNKKPVNSNCLCSYNILPKILSSQLFVIHICSSKSPPYLV